MKVLWLTPKWTLPANDGARVASYKLLKNIPKDIVKIDYLALSHPDDKENESELISVLGVESAMYVKRYLPKNTFEKLFYYLTAFLMNPLRPLTVHSFASMPIKLFLNSLLDKKDYDFIVCDGLHCVAPLIDRLNKLPIVYRAHNVEADIWRRAAKDNKKPLFSLLLRFQFLLMQKFELRLLKSAKKIFAISEDDANVFSNLVKREVEVTPIGMDFSHEVRLRERERINYLFLGRLDWPPNKDGLKWFLDKVYPKLDLNKSQIHIAGSGDRKWLESYHGLDGVTFHGYVESIDKLYQEIDCSLIPIFYGSGTRIKIIEACSFGKPVISTQMGALGSSLSPNESYAHGETEAEWAELMNNFDRQKFESYAKNAIAKLKAKYDEKVVAQALAHRLL